MSAARAGRWRAPALVAACLVAPLLALLAGAHWYGPGEALHGVDQWLRGGPDARTPSTVILLELRLPRVVGMFVVGALLAASGALLQLVLATPLADPFILGASGGAGIGALAAALLGVSQLTSLTSFVGACAATLLCLAVGRAIGGGATHVLLAGLCVSSLTGAVLSLLLLATAATGDAAPALAWLLGGIVPDDWRQIGGAACVLALLLGFAVVAARDIDALSLGDDAAHALGVSSRAVLAGVIVATTLATAMAVSLAGLVGFVGGLVPIAMRSMVASGSRSCVPACALVGGASLALLDAAARTVMWPVELPTGVLAGCIGAPLVLLVIRGEAAVRARL